MALTRDQFLEVMNNERYPRSSKYDPDWILENMMGSHCLWLQESLAGQMNLRPGMHVFDLGCGKAISSIFLAKEFDIKVWAADLWNSPTENWQRIREAGVVDKVFPIYADAHNLPFAEGYFDALMSINSLFFYVTDGEFLREKIIKYVKPGGEIGVIVPGFYREYADGVPADLKPYWSEELDQWHTLDWWADCFTASGATDILIADTLPDNEGNTIYRKSALIADNHEDPFNIIAGDNITFIRIIARRKEE